MQVQVKHGLASDLPVVYAYVVAVSTEIRLDCQARGVDCARQCHSLVD